MKAVSYPFLMGLLALVFSVGVDVQAAELVEEQWLVSTLDGDPIGWCHRTLHRTEEHYRTTLLLVEEVRVAGRMVELTTRETYIEEHDGTPVYISLRETEGEEAIKYVWDFTGPEIVETVTYGGRTRTTERERPDKAWLMAEEARRHIRQEMRAGKEEIAVRTVQAALGPEPIELTFRRVGETTFALDAEESEVTEWRVSMEGIPTPVTQYYCKDQLQVYESMRTGLGHIELTLADRETALEATRGSPPELMAAARIVPDQPIQDVMRTERVELRLEVREGRMPELPEAGGQRVIAHADDYTKILFEPGSPLPATQEEQEASTYREPSVMIDFDDEAVRELIEATEPEEPLTPAQLAEKLRAFVFEHITVKEENVLLSSASEAARSQRGDCTEHAVLLAALLRGHGIPARVAEGLIYGGTPRGYYWHMWTQALLDGRWVDLDATLPAQPHHAGYVITGVSCLSQRGPATEMEDYLKLVGNLDIEVLEVVYGR